MHPCNNNNKIKRGHKFERKKERKYMEGVGWRKEKEKMM